MASRQRIQLEEWLRKIDVKGSVLDIGGSQLPIKGRTKSWDVEKYDILDLEEPHEFKANPDYIIDINDVEFDDFSNYFSYDYIFCIEVMEYVLNPLKILEKFYNLLKDRGELYISFHFIYPEHNPVGEDVLRYTNEGVRKLLEKAGFFEYYIETKRFTKEGGRLLNDCYAKEKMRGSLYSNQGCLVKAVKV